MTDALENTFIELTTGHMDKVCEGINGWSTFGGIIVAGLICWQNSRDHTMPTRIVQTILGAVGGAMIGGGRLNLADYLWKCGVFN